MRPISDVDKLCRACDSTIRDLASATQAVLTLNGLERYRLCSHIVIELTNLWDQFARSYYFSLAFGARCGSVRRLCSGPGVTRKTIDEAIDNAILVTNPVKHQRMRASKSFSGWSFRDEPDWKVRAVLLKAIQSLQPTNIGQITSGLSIQSIAFDNLPVFRNFFAHRGSTAGKKVVNLSQTLLVNQGLMPTTYRSSSIPVETLLAYLPGSNLSLLETWIADVRNTVGFFR